MRVRGLFAVLAVVVAVAQTTLAQEEVAPGVLRIGVIENPDIAESSGVIPAKKGRGGFWTHNDGGPDVIYAISREGASLGEWKIKDANLENIEDIATGPGGLYIADIGNNTRNRDDVKIVRIPQPNPSRTGEVRPTRIWTLTYPGGAFDAESFFVFKSRGYILSRDLSGGEARLYRFPLNKRATSIELEPLCKLNVDDEPRGADLTSDGKRLAVITSSGAYLFTFDKSGIPTDGIVEPTLFVPFFNDSMEACAFTSEGLLVTSEGRNIYLFTDAAFQLPSKGRRARR